MKAWKNWWQHVGNTKSLCWLAIAALGFVVACDSSFETGENDQQNTAANTGQNDAERHMGPDRYDYVEPTGLEEGETKEGLHLRPGIEQIRLGHGISDPEVEFDPEEMTLTLSGDAREVIEDLGGVWTEDILIGDDFIYLISGVREEDGEMVIEVEPFEFTRVVHGEWDYELEPEEVGSELQMTMSTDGSISVEDGDEESQFDFSIGGFLDTALERDADDDDVTYEVGGSFDWGIDGSVSFPVDWDGTFEGKISKAGVGLNEEYECESYTEMVTKRRYWVVGEEYRVREEVQPENFCIDKLRVVGTLGVDFEFLTTLAASAEVEIGITEDVELAQMRVTLGTTGLALYFVPYVEGGMEISLEGELDMELVTDGNLELPLGFEYLPHDTGFSLLPNDFSELGEVNNEPGDVEGDVELAVDVFSALGLKMKLSDAATAKGARITGPKAGVQFGYDFNYRPIQVSLDGALQNPCAEAAVYVKAFGNANMTAEVALTDDWSWGIDLTDWEPGELRHDIFHWESEGTDWCILVGPDSLDVSLVWQADTHLELFVETPTGNTLSPDPAHSLEADGGTHHPVDQHADCKSDTEETCYARTVWEMEDPRPPTGEYWVWATNFTGEDAANFEILVSGDDGSSQNLIKHVTDALPDEQGATSEYYMFTIGE